MDNNDDDVKLTFGKSLGNSLCVKDCISFQRNQPPASRLKFFPAAQGRQKAVWPIITGVSKQEWPICGGEDSRLLLRIPSDTQLESCPAPQVLWWYLWAHKVCHSPKDMDRAFILELGESWFKWDELRLSQGRQHGGKDSTYKRNWFLKKIYFIFMFLCVYAHECSDHKYH